MVRPPTRCPEQGSVAVPAGALGVMVYLPVADGCSTWSAMYCCSSRQSSWAPIRPNVTRLLANGWTVKGSS